MKKKIAALLSYVFISTVLTAGTNSVNLIINGDLENGKTGWNNTPTETDGIYHSPTHTFYWGSFFWKQFKSVLTPIDASKTYDFSCWVASSNVFSGNSSNRCSVSLKFFDSTQTNTTGSITPFKGGGFIGFTTNGIYEGFVFFETENIEIPENTEYFQIIRTYSKNDGNGKIWFDDFYLGEVKRYGTVFILQ